MVFPFGKHRGEEISEVPLSYLTWCYEQEWMREDYHADLLEEIRLDIAERLGIQATTNTKVVEKVVYKDKIVEKVVYKDRVVEHVIFKSEEAPAPLKKPVERIIKAGFRQVSMEVHPDHGGQNGDMRQLIEARDWLNKKVS